MPIPQPRGEKVAATPRSCKTVRAMNREPTTTARILVVLS